MFLMKKSLNYFRIQVDNIWIKKAVTVVYIAAVDYR